MRIYLLNIIWMTLFLSLGCTDSNSDDATTDTSAGDSDTDTDIDGDTGGDSHADADTNADTDADTDTDADSDTDVTADTATALDTGEDTEGPVPTFEESGGYLVMEVETIPADNLAWAEETSLGGGNDSYYRYLGNDICSGPADEDTKLVYPFRLHTGGTWELRLFMARIWHCVSGTRHSSTNHECIEGEPRGCEHLADPNGDSCPSDYCLRKDLSNDVWIRIQKPDGSLMPFDDRTTEESEVKLYGGGQNAFAWSGTKSLDPAGLKKAPNWTLPAGDYELIMYGRSQGCRVDRFLFYNMDNADFDTGKIMSETLGQ